MPWREVTIVSQRFEFVMLAQAEGCNFSMLCKRFKISRKTGYKWLRRFKDLGIDGLADQSRRPHQSPLITEKQIEDLVVDLRDAHPAWGSRKLQIVLKNRGYDAVPAASTITNILHRRNKIDPGESVKHKAFIRFEHEHPNDLWQLDFKGHFAMRNGRCHPLTALDDHSRYNILLCACGNETNETAKQGLIGAFRQYGLPLRINMDNGPPWGNKIYKELTAFTVWLIQLGVEVSHSRPSHPQTNGKDERFHRTLKLEVVRDRIFDGLGCCQQAFDEFKDLYNFVRPHESLDMMTPGTRYQPSSRPYPERLPTIEYPLGDEVRKVQDKGEFSFKGKTFKVSKALRGYPIAVRCTQADGIYSVHYCGQKLMEISLRD